MDSPARVRAQQARQTGAWGGMVGVGGGGGAAGGEQVAYGAVKEALHQLYEEVGAQRVALQMLEARKCAEVQVVENALVLTATRDKQMYLEATEQALATIANKEAFLASQIDAALAALDAAAARDTAQAADEIARLSAALDTEKADRAREADAIHAAAAARIAALETELAEERRAREESETALLRMTDDLIGRLQAQLDAEKAERAATEDAILRLIEHAAARATS